VVAAIEHSARRTSEQRQDGNGGFGEDTAQAGMGKGGAKNQRRRACMLPAGF